ncbi:MAG: DUF1579 family protein [Planctomycetota bacterium]
MRKKTVLLAMLGVVGLAIAQDAGNTPTIAPPFDVGSIDHAAIGQAQMKAMMPAKEHEALDYFVGTWTTSGKMFSMGDQPGAQPMQLTGNATFEWVLGERFLREHGGGRFMGMEASFERFIGFDTNANRYQMMSMSTMSTSMSIATGLASMDGTVIVFYGPLDEPGLNLRDRTVKYILRVHDSNTFAMEVYDPHIGEEHNKVLEVTYTRE